ncbi:MAG: T3SS effector HopA1 family protein [Nostoc sp.]|uniref:T3SS effector HopA1 family protein n=1 Tax=Nostoc sp. TaxID=1180 RepID=UPI002FF4D69F
MQLGNFSQTQQPNSASQQLLDTLQDIVSNVQLHSNFCISHPNYKPLELPDEVVARFQQMPADIQNKYFGLQLRSFLYGIYYNGSMRATLAPDADSAGLALHQDLENNTRLGVDIAFYEQLHSSNRGNGYFDPGWSVVRQESDGTLAVTKGGLTLYIEPDKHLQLAEQSAAIGELVAIRMPRNFVQSGFYMAVSNAGPRSNSHPNREPEIVRIYFNFSPEGAVAVMDSLTRELNDISISFTFKVLYNPSEYRRYDSGVLYFEKSNYQVVRQGLESVYAQTKEHFNPDVPLFTKFLAPGLGLAEEPDRKFAEQESFGMNRCQIIANGLLEAWHSLDDSPEGRITSILKQFSRVGVELQRSYLNANSVDIYMPLNF